jgi:hypothetical protein
MSVSTYVEGFYARLDNLTQLQRPDELKGHLLLKQTNLEQSEKAMVITNDQEAPLLEDLVEYKNNRDKGVVMDAGPLSCSTATLTLVGCASEIVAVRPQMPCGRALWVQRQRMDR